MGYCEVAVRGDEYKTVWVTNSHHDEKSWGHELTIGSLSTIQAKILYIKKGSTTSLKYYTTKNEMLFIRSGKVLVEYDSEKYHYQDPEERALKNQVLLPGDVLCVQSQCPYKIIAMEDSEIFEIGDSRTGHVVRIDEES